ncbi:hypothetical protein Leryth_020286 [Lithospermum erythrorhizon]|nr:hypothetical protein Leryth_020286 [Lithospermum erythrorhizon]
MDVPWGGDENDENGQFVRTHKIYKMEDSEGKSWSLWCELDFDERVTPLGFRENGEFLWVEYQDFRYVSITLEHGFTRRSISMNHENTSDICHPVISYMGNHISSFPNYVESLALLDATMKPPQPRSL